ncbi:MAG: quinoprotein dehydrogenase-associated SoxYZ-like carrier [Acetobacteraceae bacterium]|nr:quinoprotein dehydrogenase-associated SoxYZ-like carrier [Acetobacteraceae bacterium]
MRALARLTVAACVGLLATGAVARADDEDAARAARWRDLRHAVFGDRPVADGAGVVSLEAPARALDAALVPIAVTLSGAAPVKALYVLIDSNPSPLAGTFHFGPLADPHSLKLRVRVDQYTLMHAVAETEDGGLFAAERFVKAAGGCSAPATSNQELAMRRLGQMKLRVLDDPGAGRPETVELLISHPNNNGMQMDQVTRTYTPARFIQTVRVSYGPKLVFDLDSDISLSEDPAITFGLLPEGAGPLRVEVDDSAKAVFKKEFALAAGRS